jgi:uncharacterized phage-associated protein
MFPQRQTGEASMKYSSLRVASQIASVCQENNLFYNNTKIQKLLYCCYGCSLVILKDRLCDEYPRAWQFGPVFPRVFNYINKKRDLLSPELALVGAPDKVLSLIDVVVKTFGKYTATYLSAWTHQPGSPWHQVIEGMGEGLGSFIPDDIIADYFQKNVVMDGQNAAQAS